MKTKAFGQEIFPGRLRLSRREYAKIELNTFKRIEQIHLIFERNIF